ncbi:MAG: hypothetical protein LBE17_13895 [Treponema sp.]|jgi:hypothetical protein|nr:hypothetical protein [Treponema sp.]
MRYPQDAGVFIGIGELLAIFPRIKRDEYTMTPAERQVLTKLEKVLYEYLTVEEVENLMVVSGSRVKGEGEGR